MFWFVIIVLIVMMCAGVIGLAMGVKLLRFGEDVAGQKRTLRVVLISFIDFLAGGFALAAVATKIIDPLVGLIITIVVLIVAQLGLRSMGSTTSKEL